EDDFKIDIVTARREYYEYPAALPVVEKGSIKDDLFRRDFTVNSMAIKLNKREFGMLVDFYGGRKDLMSGLIRILYNLSFIEDPTRIFRAIRFEQRYGFKMEDKTLGFAVNAIQSGVLNDVSRERINFEFFALLKEKNILGILDRMSELSILEKIYPEVKYTENVRKTFKNCDEWLTDFQNSLNSMENIDRILLYILILHSNMDALNTLASSEKMRLTREYREEISKLIDARDNTLPHLLRDTGVSSFDIYNALKGLSIEVLFVLYLLNDNTLLRNRVIDYINRLRSIKTSITGKDLKELGIKPGPLFKSILDKVLEEKVNGSITTYEEELELAGKIKDTKENG
ncbi:MAG: polynucleotide adenylyltransferase, partial [Bacillota bacterium]